MNRRCMWFTELFLWAAVLVIISVVTVFFQSVHQQKTNSYYMFFTDIDGLTKGSPVRLMGMQVGYVQQLKVFDDKVYVSFLVTEKNVKMPEPATATVEFYGLGGSKSLEIEPIKATAAINDDYIIAKEPYRIQSFYDATNRIARTLVSISNSFTNIVDEDNLNETRKQLIFSSKIKKINCYVQDINKETTKCLNRVNAMQENNNAKTGNRTK